MTKSVSVINFSMWVSRSHPFSDTPSEWQFLDTGSVWYVVPPLFTENLMFSWLPQKKIEEQAMSIVCHFTKQRIKRIKDSWRANFQRCQTWDWIINNNWITTRTEAKFTLDYFFLNIFTYLCVRECRGRSHQTPATLTAQGQCQKPRSQDSHPSNGMLGARTTCLGPHLPPLKPQELEAASGTAPWHL